VGRKKKVPINNHRISKIHQKYNNDHLLKNPSQASSYVVYLFIYLFIYCFILCSGLWAPSQSEDGTTLEYTIQYRLWTVVTPVYDTFTEVRDRGNIWKGQTKPNCSQFWQWDPVGYPWTMRNIPPNILFWLWTFTEWSSGYDII
jgi:hypothetical protein